MVEVGDARDLVMLDFSRGELGDTQIIRFRDPETYFLTNLFFNKHYMAQLSEWFPSRDVGTVLLKYLIHPSNAVWMDVLDSWQRRPKMAPTVGVQVRYPVLFVQAAVSCLDSLPSHSHFFVASLLPCAENISAIDASWTITQAWTNYLSIQLSIH